MEFSSRKYRDLNKANASQEILFWRELWERLLNERYERKGLKERVSCLSCEEQGNLKEYEHIDSKKYQALRSYGELEGVKKVSRINQELKRTDLRIEDLMEVRKELLKEQEVLEKEEKENVWQRKEYRGTEPEVDRSRKTIKRDEGERRETRAESRSLLENLEREFTGKRSSSEAEYGDYKTTKGITSFIKFLLTGRDKQRDSENHASDRGIEGRTEERSRTGKLSGFAQRVFQRIGDMWRSLFKKKALKKVEDQALNIKFDPEKIPDFNEVKISSKQKLLGQSLTTDKRRNTEDLAQRKSGGIKF